MSHLPPTSSSLPGLPLVRDPLDARYTDVLPSTIPGAGEGLFARKDVEAFTIVSVFSGLTMSKQEYMERATSSQSRSVTFPEQLPREGTESGPGCSELVTPNAIGLDPGQVILKLTQARVFQPDQVVDIPFNVEYTASSGHKANHDMLRPNCRYVPLETPRFGRSMAVETIMKVNKKWSVCYGKL